jgi:hypothetical protein
MQNLQPPAVQYHHPSLLSWRDRSPSVMVLRDFGEALAGCLTEARYWGFAASPPVVRLLCSDRTGKQSLARPYRRRAPCRWGPQSLPSLRRLSQADFRVYLAGDFGPWEGRMCPPTGKAERDLRSVTTPWQEPRSASKREQPQGVGPGTQNVIPRADFLLISPKGS